MVLQVGVKALCRRREELNGAAQSVEAQENRTDSATVSMLLFYAAECGLKERVLVRGGHRDTRALEPTHDLRVLAKALRLPRNIDLDGLQRCRRHSSTKAGPIHLHELHQAWRYGVKVHAEDEKKAQSVLRSLITWCEQDGR